MEKLTKKLISKLKDDLGIGKGGAKVNAKRKAESKKNDNASAEGPEEEEEEESEEVPFEKKVAFTEKVRRLTNDGLTRLVKKCKDLCPQAIEDVDSEKLHIKVDMIDKVSFDSLSTLVDENLSTKR